MGEIRKFFQNFLKLDKFGVIGKNGENFAVAERRKSCSCTLVRHLLVAISSHFVYSRGSTAILKIAFNSLLNGVFFALASS